MSTITSSRSAYARIPALRAARVTPELIWFIASAKKRVDPYPSYRKALRIDPVHHSPLGVWVVFPHAEVSSILRNPTFSSDEQSADLSTLRLGPLRRVLGRDRPPEGRSQFLELMRQLMLFRDPPDHTRLRGLVNKAFTPKTVQRLEQRGHQLVAELLDEIVPTGHTDLMQSFAYPFPARVICELIGVPASDTPYVISLAPHLASGLDPSPFLTKDARQAAEVATAGITEYLVHLIALRRREPADDMVSALLCTEDGDVLSDDELVAMVGLILMAGHETTANLLGNAIVALLGQPARARELRDNPALDASAVDELLRFDSPVQMTLRFTTGPVEIAGHSVDPGSAVVLCTGAANRDGAAYADPDRLDWYRANNPHLAFGGGAHFCLGAPLARMETRIALRAILDRMPDLQLAGDPVHRPSFTIRGLTSLPLTWTPN